MALPLTTHRAALAAAHPLHLVEQETAPLQREPATVQPLVGCMTGASNTINEHLARLDLPPKVSRFLRCLERATFGWAGVHRAQGREQPGAWCPFVLADWVESTQMSRSQILHVRARLVDDGLIWYEADERVRGCGRIGWNLDTATWKPLQPGYRRWGGARPGAGRPRKLLTTSGVVTLKNGPEGTGQEDASARPTPDKNSSLQFMNRAEKSCLQQAEQGEKSRLQQPGNSSLPLAEGSPEFKMTTPLPVEPALEVAASPAIRSKLRKKKTETPIVVSEMLCLSQESMLDSTKDEDASRIQESEAEDPSSLPASTDQPVYWPPRQTWERTDLDYYQRVLRERDKERVALLVRLAHERIGVLLEKASYARIGALAKQCGAALLVKHILLAAANHIDGDPLDYLTKLARGQQRKETNHATRPTATSNSQPYTAEEASHLVWRTL